MGKKHKTESEKLEILKYLREYGLNDTVEKYGVSGSSIRFWDALYNSGNRFFSIHTRAQTEEDDFLSYIKENDEATAEDIAKHFGWSMTKARNIASHFGVKLTRKTKVTSEIKEVILANPLLSLRQISKKFNVSEAVLYKTCQKYNIQRERIKINRRVNPTEVSSYIKEHPKATLTEIGRFFGVSRQFIHQIIGKHRIAYEPKRSWFSKQDEVQRKFSKIIRYAKEHPQTSIREIANIFHLSEHIIYRRLHDAGIHRKKPTKVDYNKVREMLLCGATYSQIVKKMNISTSLISKIVRKYGLQKRK